MGFLASITIGLQGDELTEMAALDDAGALGFTDDGKPVVSAGMLRKALQYQRLAGGVIALHEEDPALSGDGVMHEGAVVGAAGHGRDPVDLGVDVGRPRRSDRPLRGRARALPAPRLRGVGRGARGGQGRPGARVSGEVRPHHLTLTDELVRTLDSRFKMNPPLRTETDRQALVEGLRRGTIECVATDHAPHARHEKEMPFEQAPMGTTGLETAFVALYTELVRSGELSSALVIERMTAGGALYGLPIPRIAPGEPANLCWSTSSARGWWARTGTPAARRTAASTVARCSGRVELTVAAGAIAYRRRCSWPPTRRADRRAARQAHERATAYVLLEDGTRFDGLACGADAQAVGEIVFTTSMSGYQEAMTDPSYAGQLIAFTYPQIGNYGVSDGGDGVRRIHARARSCAPAVDRDERPAQQGWLSWLADQACRRSPTSTRGRCPPHP